MEVQQNRRFDQPHELITVMGILFNKQPLIVDCSGKSMFKLLFRRNPHNVLSMITCYCLSLFRGQSEWNVSGSESKHASLMQDMWLHNTVLQAHNMYYMLLSIPSTQSKVSVSQVMVQYIKDMSCMSMPLSTYNKT